MSMAVQCIDYPSFYAIPSGIGFSDDFKDLVRNIKNQIQKICEPLTIGRPLEEAVKSLLDIYKECSEENWDGYNALPITADAFEEARNIIKLLPTSVPMPEILAEPGGEIGFEWRKGDRLVFVLSVGGKHKINYTGIFGSNKLHGSEYFGESLPSVIIGNLGRLYS